MARACSSNEWLSRRIAQALADLNGAAVLRLFKNNLSPNPGTLLSAFVEATFTGYAPFDLSGTLVSDGRIIDGEYQLHTAVATFTCTAGAGQDAFGWYLTGGGDWLFAARFAAPIPVDVDNALTLRLRPQDWALCVACP